MSQATEEVNHADIDRCDSEIRDLKGRDARSSSAIDAIDRTEARCSWTARGVRRTSTAGDIVPHIGAVLPHHGVGVIHS